MTAWAGRVQVPAVISSERGSRSVTLLGVDPAAELILGSLPENCRRARAGCAGRQGS